MPVANVVTLEDIDGNVINTFSTIQQAVNAASNGDQILVGPGTYQEQVLVNGLQNLTIKGSGQGTTTILSPDAANLQSEFVNPDEQFFPHQMSLLAGINGASVNVQDLTIDGRDQGAVPSVGGSAQSDQGELIGIDALNSSFNVSNVHVTRIDDIVGGVIQGGQRNRAILVDDNDGSTQAFTLSGSTIDNFQKNGLLAKGTGLSVDVNHNVFVGAGTTPINLSQNILEVESGVVGSVTSNTVSGITDQNGGSAGIVILADGQGFVVSNNTVMGLAGNVNSSGIYVGGTDAIAEGNTITNQGFALTEDGQNFGAFTTALVQDNNSYSGNGVNYTFFVDPTSPTAWFVTGTGGPDDIEGGANNDVFSLLGHAANSNVFVGNGGVDTVTGYGAGYAADISSGQWEVTNGTLSDLLSSIEKVGINGKTFDLVDQLGANIGGFQSIQAAVNAANPGEIILAAAGASPVAINVTVNNLTFEPAQTYTGITLNVQVPVRTVSLADFAPGQGVALTVNANDLGDKIVGNDGADDFVGGKGADTFVVKNSTTTVENLNVGDVIYLPNLAFSAGAMATFSGGILTVVSNGVTETVALNNPAQTTFNVMGDGAGGTDVTFFTVNPFISVWNINEVGDPNGDDKSDLVWRRSTDGVTEIQFLNGTTPAGGGVITNNVFDASWSIVGAGDFNDDGKSDLVWRRGSSTEIQFLNGLMPVGGGLIVNNVFDSSWTIAGVGDFNGDGNSDLIWRHTGDGATQIQFLNGNTAVGGGTIANNPFDSSWAIAGVGDFNGDGKADLVWRHAGDGATQIQFINGNTAVGGGTIANNPFDSSWAIAGVGDFNGDGNADLVWRHSGDGLTEIQLLNGLSPVGGGVITNNAFDTTWSIVGVGDFNGDGKSDLVWRRASDGLTEVQFLNGNMSAGGGAVGSALASAGDAGNASAGISTGFSSTVGGDSTSPQPTMIGGQVAQFVQAVAAVPNSSSPLVSDPTIGGSGSVPYSSPLAAPH